VLLRPGPTSFFTAAQIKDGSVLLTGAAPNKDTYLVTVRTKLTGMVKSVGSGGMTMEVQLIGLRSPPTFNFTGTGISWIGARGPQTGIARVLLDGNVVADSIDTFAQTEGPQHADFFASGLAAGTHTLTIQVTGKNPISTDAWILIDAFDVTQ